MQSDDPESSHDDDSFREPPTKEVSHSHQLAEPPPAEDSLSQATTAQSSSTTPSPAADNKCTDTSVSPIGQAVVKFADLVNDNLIAARYVSMATIGLIAAYGIAHTPLFFRYHTVSELPSSFFGSRKTIRCRLVKSLASDDMSLKAAATASSSLAAAPTNHPILLQVRHLSPFESMLLSKTWYDRWIKWHPTAAVINSTVARRRRHDEDEEQLLTIQIAGIEAPHFYFNPTSSEKPGEWLERLVADKTRVICQLLARRVGQDEPDANYATLFDKNRNNGGATRNILSATDNRIKKRALPEIQNTNNNLTKTSSEWDTDVVRTTTSHDQRIPRNEVAIVKLYYRPKPFQLWATDIGQSMVRFGRAATSGSSELFLKQDRKDRIVDASEAVRDWQNDAAYLDLLSAAEYKAASGSYGMWGDPTIRASKAAVVEEVEFRTNAPWWRKAWRWIRGG